ncbi:MAG: sugar ABC transporter ATP-binding protein [Planctomycetota bacterium]|nr:MAG: sugar ABC transporter ATP-binding protein [Planctomycetota bacterium]REJ91205.1 MAG: sugar ABC transporter ATP-binding protein [Planctomycetota bacterium]REK22206.1 MAG: sugar ABC transporter ATP-binding protein [Planctomycetota bacterium]REK44272.1 MAG: sugar ABC transporter ATP-binding protein [Planctomycetota bacterium]
MSSETTPLLEVRNVSKRFPGVQALSRVALRLNRGEVLAVIGENGAGKSTLMKILAGVQEPDEGEIRVGGKAVQFRSVNDALSAGVVLIHQELNLADNLDVAANIYLGREPRFFGLIRKRRLHEDASTYLELTGLGVDPRALVNTLPIGKQQMVEIAKALSANAQILIMDEPTSSLSLHESEALFDVIRELRTRGVGIIYISHRLGEVKDLADRVTVMRDGENAGDLRRDEITHDNMVVRMVGREVSQFYAREPHEPGDVVLEVRGLVTPAWPQRTLDFRLRAGEIVGVAGLVGAGRTEMLQALFGVDEPLAGDILVGGRRMKFEAPKDAIAAGMALVPEDRKRHGLITEMTVRENVSLAGLMANRRPAGFINSARETEATSEMVQQLRIRTPGHEQVCQYLSGGNQQKVVIGKWLSLRPRILLMDEPTRGIDIGAKEEIYKLMESLARDGVAILFVSSEMEEVLGMSDRTIVMHEGAITGELKREQLSEEAIMQLATGNVTAQVD